MFNQTGIYSLISSLNVGIKTNQSQIFCKQVKHGVLFLKFLERQGVIYGHKCVGSFFLIYLRYNVRLYRSTFKKIFISQNLTKRGNLSLSSRLFGKNMNQLEVFWFKGNFYVKNDLKLLNTFGVFVCCILF